jgi:hypothetical protein
MLLLFNQIAEHILTGLADVLYALHKQLVGLDHFLAAFYVDHLETILLLVLDGLFVDELVDSVTSTLLLLAIHLIFALPCWRLDWRQRSGLFHF